MHGHRLTQGVWIGNVVSQTVTTYKMVGGGNGIVRGREGELETARCFVDKQRVAFELALKRIYV